MSLYISPAAIITTEEPTVTAGYYVNIWYFKFISFVRNMFQHSKTWIILWPRLIEQHDHQTEIVTSKGFGAVISGLLVHFILLIIVISKRQILTTTIFKALSQQIECIDLSMFCLLFSAMFPVKQKKKPITAKNDITCFRIFYQLPDLATLHTLFSTV